MRRPSGAETGRTLAGHRQTRASGTRVVDSEPYGGPGTPAGSRWNKACRLNQVSGYGAMAVMKAKDESSTPVGTSPTAADGPTTEIRDGTDRHRRRLIRGASALPMLLTLRSKGLAAQSCTGARYEQDKNVYPPNNAFTLGKNDVALKSLERCQVGGLTDDHEKIYRGTEVALGTDCWNAKVTANGETITCDGTNNPDKGYYCCNVEIAVVSGAAWASIVERGP